MLRFTSFQISVISGLLFLVGLGSYRLYGQRLEQQQLQEEVLTANFEPLPGPAGQSGPIEKLSGQQLLDVREQMKININTADGTEKYTTNSLGIGTPSEVSLEMLFGGTNATNARSIAQQVVQRARTNGFSSPHEILRVPGVTNSHFADNVFSITSYSRSPELNVFGQPRMSMAPASPAKTPAIAIATK